MFRIVKFIFFSILGSGLIALGYAAWFVLTPVTAANVETRIQHFCAIGQVVEQTGAVRSPELAGVSCNCWAPGLMRTVGAVGSARSVELVRTAFAEGLKAKAAGGKFSPIEYLSRADIADVEAFLNAGKKAMAECRGNR